jgi:hypothetical protein
MMSFFKFDIIINQKKIDRMVRCLKFCGEFSYLFSFPNISGQGEAGTKIFKKGKTIQSLRCPVGVQSDSQ